MIPLRKCKNLFHSPDSINLLVTYSGPLLSQLEPLPYACGYIIDSSFAVIAVAPTMINELVSKVPSITNVDKTGSFTLQALQKQNSQINTISPIEAAQIRKVQQNTSLNITGKNIVVGVIDTGIDYLNEAFMFPDGTTKILRLWDQTIENSDSTEVPFGKVFTNIDINNAINAKKQGKNPYDIVNSVDDLGHGTEMSGIISGSGTNKSFYGVAPECELVVIKLKRTTFLEKYYESSIIDNTPIYSSSDIALAIKYLYDFFLSTINPLVIFIGLGSNLGSHTGLSLIERYISTLSINNNFIVVSGTGNQGDSSIHTSGFINGVGEAFQRILEVDVLNLKNFTFQIWVSSPDKILIGIASPSGETLEVLNSSTNLSTVLNFSYENTMVAVSYYSPYDLGGGQLIEINFQNTQNGVWTFYLIGQFITTGRYDAWLPQRELIGNGTKFSNTDKFTTLMIPSTCNSVVSVASYNQLNDTINQSSGRGFNANNIDNPIVAAGGINQLTTSIGGKETFVSGSSVATAVVAGSIALFLDWIKITNRSSVNVQGMKSIIAQNAIRQNGVFYPTPTFGYGLFDLERIFKGVR